MIIPSIIHAAVVKKTKGTHLGLSLMMQNGGLVVSNISPDSPFGNTELRVGYEVLSINRGNFTDATKAVAFLKQVEGPVEIMASDHPFPSGGVLSFVKNYPKELINSLEFSRLNGNLVRIDHIHSRGPFAKTKIEVGDVVLTVNNKVVADPVVASRLLLSCEEHNVCVLTLSRRKFLEAAIKTMVLKQDKSKPWTKPVWISPNKIQIGRQDWDKHVVLRFGDTTGGICEIDEPWLFLEPDIDSETPFKVKYSDWYHNTVIPRLGEINEYIKENVANIEVAVRRSPYREVYPDEQVVEKLAKLAIQHKSHKLTDKEYTAAKYKLLGIRAVNHMETSC